MNLLPAKGAHRNSRTQLPCIETEPQQLLVETVAGYVIFSADYCFPECLLVLPKVYRLGGETDSAIRRRKRTVCAVVERLSGSWLLRTFLKISLKMPSIFCEFVCYNRKLCVNKR